MADAKRIFFFAADFREDLGIKIMRCQPRVQLFFICPDRLGIKRGLQDFNRVVAEEHWILKLVFRVREIEREMLPCSLDKFIEKNLQGDPARDLVLIKVEERPELWREDLAGTCAKILTDLCRKAAGQSRFFCNGTELAEIVRVEFNGLNTFGGDTSPADDLFSKKKKFSAGQFPPFHQESAKRHAFVRFPIKIVKRWLKATGRTLQEQPANPVLLIKMLQKIPDPVLRLTARVRVLDQYKGGFPRITRIAFANSSGSFWNLEVGKTKRRRLPKSERQSLGRNRIRGQEEYGHKGGNGFR